MAENTVPGTIMIEPMHDWTIGVRKEVPSLTPPKPESIEEEPDLDFLTSIDTDKGDEDEVKRPKRNRR